MGQSWQDVYESFCDVLLADYRTEPERQEAVAKAIEGTLKTMLEKLRDSGLS